MLSDEEKKAIEKIEKLIEYLKKWNQDFTIVPKDVKYFEKILDMTKTHLRMIDENIEEILEQSKEIEELNKSDASKEQSSMNYYILYKELVDRIQTKIEEVQNMKAKAKDIVFKSSLNYIETELQSLLEKE